MNINTQKKIKVIAIGDEEQTIDIQINGEKTEQGYQKNQNHNIQHDLQTGANIRTYYPIEESKKKLKTILSSICNSKP